MLQDSFCLCNGNRIDLFTCPSCARAWHQPSQRWTDRIAILACPYCGESVNAFSALDGGCLVCPARSRILIPTLEDFGMILLEAS